jgi:hypothetical protein
MMKSTPEEIEAALVNYRKITPEGNKRALQVYINAIINTNFKDKHNIIEISEEGMKIERTGQLSDIVQVDLGELTRQTELMDRPL